MPRPAARGTSRGSGPQAVAAAVEAQNGSLVRAVESLRRPEGQSLRMFEPPEQNIVARALAQTELLDAEHTPDRVNQIRRDVPAPPPLTSASGSRPGPVDLPGATGNPTPRQWPSVVVAGGRREAVTP